MLQNGFIPSFSIQHLAFYLYVSILSRQTTQPSGKIAISGTSHTMVFYHFCHVWAILELSGKRSGLHAYAGFVRLVVTIQQHPICCVIGLLMCR